LIWLKPVEAFNQSDGCTGSILQPGKHYCPTTLSENDGTGAHVGMNVRTFQRLKLVALEVDFWREGDTANNLRGMV
jgi:hypothetical protein